VEFKEQYLVKNSNRFTMFENLDDGGDDDDDDGDGDEDDDDVDINSV